MTTSNTPSSPTAVKSLSLLTEKLSLGENKPPQRLGAIFSGKENEADPPISLTLSAPLLLSEESSDSDDRDSADEARVPSPVVEPPAKKYDDPQSHNNGSFRGRPSSCVFVASLSSSMSDDHLCMSVTKHFQKWGELTMVKVLRDTSNRPYAFVQFSTDATAKRAILEGQHSILDGRSIRCESARVNRTLYLAPESTETLPLAQVRDTMEAYGEVEQLVPYPFYGGHPRTSRSAPKLNHAYFCKYAYRDDAIRAYANLRTNRSWVVEWAQNLDSPADMIEDVTIDKFSVFVGQLDPRATEEGLVERFGKHGTVAEAVLVQRPNNNCFGFIKFETEAAAAAAVEKENHAIFMEKTMHVQYREMHHNNHKRSSEMKLTLAPPPINLPSRRASTGTASSRSSFGRSSGPFSRNRRASGEQVNLRAESMYPPRPFKSTTSFSSSYGHAVSSAADYASYRGPRFNRYDIGGANGAYSYRDPGIEGPPGGLGGGGVDGEPHRVRTETSSHTPSKTKQGKSSTPGSSPSVQTAGSPGVTKTLYSPSAVSFSDQVEEGMDARSAERVPAKATHPAVAASVPSVPPHFYYVPTKEVYGAYEFPPLSHAAVPPYYYGYQPYPPFDGGMEYPHGGMAPYYMYYPQPMPFNAPHPSELPIGPIPPNAGGVSGNAKAGGAAPLPAAITKAGAVLETVAVSGASPPA